MWDVKVPWSHVELYCRFEDPFLLERYRMITQQPFAPYAHPSMLPPGMPPLLPPGAHYPPELLGHQLPLVSPGSKLTDHRSPGGERLVKAFGDRFHEVNCDSSSKHVFYSLPGAKTKETSLTRKKLQRAMLHGIQPLVKETAVKETSFFQT